MSILTAYGTSADKKPITFDITKLGIKDLEMMVDTLMSPDAIRSKVLNWKELEPVFLSRYDQGVLTVRDALSNGTLQPGDVTRIKADPPFGIVVPAKLLVKYDGRMKLGDRGSVKGWAIDGNVVLMLNEDDVSDPGYLAAAHEVYQNFLNRDLKEFRRMMK